VIWDRQQGATFQLLILNLKQELYSKNQLYQGMCMLLFFFTSRFESAVRSLVHQLTSLFAR
jgi:hypothetical protein